MDNSAKNRVPEHSSTRFPESGPEENVVKRDSDEARRIKEVAASGEAAYVETVGLDEGAETTGKVSEIKENAQDDIASGVFAKANQAKMLDPAQIRQRLLNKIPTEQQMRQLIEKEIKEEIAYLHKKAVRMIRSPGKMSYFEMTHLMKKIRELKGILIQLINASLDTLKTLWLRYVHGIM